MSSNLGELLDKKILQSDPTDSAMIKKGQTLRIIIYDPDGTWGIRPPDTKPGDHIDLLVEMDMLWAVSICNDPWSNGEQPTAVQFELYDAA
jgi:uncharacterized protein YcgI (DUF1989 family)